MKRFSIILIIAAVSLFGQAAQYGVYSVERKASLSGSAEVLTCRLGTSSVRMLLAGVSVYSSVATEFTIERDGTYSSGSALTEISLNPDFDATPSAVCTHTTSITSTTVFARHVTPAGGTLPIDLSNVEIGSNEAITIRTASITGTAIINLVWKER